MLVRLCTTTAPLRRPSTNSGPQGAGSLPRPEERQVLHQLARRFRPNILDSTAWKVLDRSALTGRDQRLVRVASLDELRAKRMIVVKGERCPILVEASINPAREQRKRVIVSTDGVGRCAEVGCCLDRGAMGRWRNLGVAGAAQAGRVRPSIHTRRRML
jgi:hypothetical protein